MTGPATVWGLALLIGALFCGCPRAPYNPTIDPANFVDVVDNPYFPLEPGKTYVYVLKDSDPVEEDRVAVTGDKKTILGVSCTVVHDVVKVGDSITEDTFDWYAQDTDGNVWYFGEDTKEYDNGNLVSTEGSWEAGVDGAKPGIVMKADPQPGPPYRQEYAPGVAEDMAQVLALNQTATVPFGTFDDCLKTREFTPLEPGVNEFKYYAPDWGLVLTVTPEGREELTQIIGQI